MEGIGCRWPEALLYTNIDMLEWLRRVGRAVGRFAQVLLSSC